MLDRATLREKLFNIYILSDSTDQFKIYVKFINKRLSFLGKQNLSWNSNLERLIISLF